jgi:hypothetical protein
MVLSTVQIIIIETIGSRVRNLFLDQRKNISTLATGGFFRPRQIPGIPRWR